MSIRITRLMSASSMHGSKKRRRPTALVHAAALAAVAGTWLVLPLAAKAQTPTSFPQADQITGGKPVEENWLRRQLRTFRSYPHLDLAYRLLEAGKPEEAKPDGDRLHVLVRIPLPVLLMLDLPKSGPGRMDDKLEEATAAFARAVVFYESDRPLVREGPSRARISLPSDPSFESFESALDNIRGPALAPGTQISWNDGYLDAYLRYPIRSDSSAFAIDMGLYGGSGARLKMFVRFITPDGTTRAYELNGDSGLFLLDPGWYRAAWTFGELGFEHILGGIDHLLFLLCLVIPFGLANFRALLAVISTFTVAHSITLIASASGWAPTGGWFPPLVETLIALSILYMALENIVVALRQARSADAGMLRRCLIVGTFGLVHGFGFSFILSEQLQFAGNHLLLSLLSFNFGVEIGQIAFLAVTLPLVSVVLRQKDDRRIGIVIVSTLVAHVAWHWLSERWESLAIAARPLLDDVDTASAVHLALLLAFITAVISAMIGWARSNWRSAQPRKRMSPHG